MPQGVQLKLEDKQRIIAVRNEIEREKEAKTAKKIVRLTAERTGFSEHTVWRVWSEYRRNHGGFDPPPLKRYYKKGRQGLNLEPWHEHILLTVAYLRETDPTWTSSMLNAKLRECGLVVSHSRLYKELKAMGISLNTVHKAPRTDGSDSTSPSGGEAALPPPPPLPLPPVPVDVGPHGQPAAVATIPDVAAVDGVGVGDAVAPPSDMGRAAPFVAAQHVNKPSGRRVSAHDAQVVMNPRFVRSGHDVAVPLPTAGAAMGDLSQQRYGGDYIPAPARSVSAMGLVAGGAVTAGSGGAALPFQAAPYGYASPLPQFQQMPQFGARVVEGPAMPAHMSGAPHAMATGGANGQHAQPLSAHTLAMLTHTRHYGAPFPHGAPATAFGQPPHGAAMNYALQQQQQQQMRDGAFANAGVPFGYAQHVGGFQGRDLGLMLPEGPGGAEFGSQDAPAQPLAAMPAYGNLAQYGGYGGHAGQMGGMYGPALAAPLSARSMGAETHGGAAFAGGDLPYGTAHGHQPPTDGLARHPSLQGGPGSGIGF